MKRDDQALSWKYRNHLGRFEMLTAKACSETAFLREYIYRKYISYDDHLFFQNV